MQDQSSVSILVKEVSIVHGKLKELLGSNRDPWDKDTEFQRQKLRKLYLQLLLCHPYAPQSKAVDTRMWLDTSHAFIAVYKDKLAQLDKIISAPPETRPPSRSRHGPVEYRKLAQRFRQFLAEEEKFWIAFVTRFVRLFALELTKPTLALLGIVVSDPEDSPPAPGQQRARPHIFPEEGDPYSVSPGQLPDRLLILSKALVSIGDIARYREQWNESGGRPRAGKETHDEPARRGGRGGRREPAPRPRNYARARDCYEQARAMYPESGNASHQLAILASYESETFNSLYHYYRSLCVRKPYTAALENMEKQMSRYLETHLPSYNLSPPEGEEIPPRIQVDNFKESVIILHSLWRSDQSDKYDLSLFSDAVVRQLESQVAERVLPSELICKTVVLAIGALWTHRMYRGPKTRESKKRAPLETLILCHILDVFRVLMQIGISELADTTSTPADTALDIAQHITAVLRRMLPSLRICTKWLVTNLDSVSGPQAPTGPELSDTAAKLWDAYTDFASLLIRVFPMETLRPMRGALEEDVDMTGFAPLKKSMYQPCTETANGLAPSHSEVHPNEEQLMRIHDLLHDAMEIAKVDDSPIACTNGKFVRVQLDLPAEPSTSPLDFIPPSVSDYAHIIGQSKKAQEVKPVDEDDARTVSTEDPVRLAMDATLSDEDDDEEQILYPKNPKSLMTPGRTTIPVARPVPSSPVSPLLRPQMHTRTSSTTAMDLVNTVLGGRHLNDPLQKSRAPPPPMLFGAGPSNLASIWSTSHDAHSPTAAHSGPMAQQAPHASFHTPNGSFSQVPNGSFTSHTPNGSFSAPNGSFSTPNGSFSQMTAPSQSPWSSSLNTVSPTRAYYQQAPPTAAFPAVPLAPQHLSSIQSQSSSPYPPYNPALRQPVARPRSYFEPPGLDAQAPAFVHPAMGGFPLPGTAPMQSRPWS
ncbi:hypothetical protein AURDEDRAFT_142836 [Auricularia subglabra TFB-10046 SS5]|nr:hypothetical protein AURDEDRAFT_142836 [Auricularia subglabra TFB-10046 SS5]